MVSAVRDILDIFNYGRGLFIYTLHCMLYQLDLN